MHSKDWPRLLLYSTKMLFNFLIDMKTLHYNNPKMSSVTQCWIHSIQLLLGNVNMFHGSCMKPSAHYLIFVTAAPITTTKGFCSQLSTKSAGHNQYLYILRMVTKSNSTAIFCEVITHEICF